MKKKTLVALLLGFLLIFTACGNKKEADNNTSSNKATTEEGKKVEGVSRGIVIAQAADIDSLDPQKQNDTMSINSISNIYNTLFVLDKDNKFQPVLVDSYEFLDDKNVKFKLKEGIKFHDGSTLKAEDVQFTLMRQKESSRVGHLVSMIDSVEVVDDNTFIIHMNEPNSTLISSLAHPGASILSKAYTEKLESEGKKLSDYPMGTGPYKFVSWTPGDNVKLERFDDYFGEKAKNAGIEFRVIPEESSRTMALEAGEVDIVANVGLQDVDRIKDNKDLKLLEFPSTRIEYMVINSKKKPFDNQLVREALNYAVDKQAIITVAANGQAEPLDSYISPYAVGASDDVVKYSYDLDKAKELLKEAGYPDGFSTTIMVGSDARARAAQVIQASLNEIGIKADIETMESGVFYDRTGKGDHELGMAGWAANGEPDNTYRPLFYTAESGDGGNRSFTSYPDVDKWIDEASQTQDMNKRNELYSKVMHKLTEEAIWVPIYNQNGLIAKRAYVDGIIPSSIGINRFDQVTISE